MASSSERPTEATRLLSVNKHMTTPHELGPSHSCRGNKSELGLARQCAAVLAGASSFDERWCARAVDEDAPTGGVDRIEWWENDSDFEVGEGSDGGSDEGSDGGRFG